MTTYVVSSLSPATGSTAGGTPVTITGSNFTGATGVTFAGGAATSFVVVNDTTITCVTPAESAGTASVIVAGTNTSNGANTDYTYGAPPTVSSVSPATGNALGSTPVTITGTNFTGATAVTFGGNAATGVVVVNSTTITCNTPAHAAGAISVLVTTPYGVNAGNTAYTTNADIITGWSTAGPQGAGTGFAQTVTTTVNSPITLDSGYIELVVDVAHVLNKQDVIRALERIMGAIISDTWPPSGKI